MASRYQRRSITFVIQQTIKVVAQKGWRQVLSSAWRFLRLSLSSPVEFFMFQFRTNKRFEFRGSQYDYFCHWYNQTWRNERSIEIPIFFSIMQNYRQKHILEVGNVMSWYFPVHHDIVDKYEQAHRVINCDIIDFKPVTQYDLIISISTIEHIGQDEVPFNPVKSLHAVNHLLTLLKPQGKLIFSVPVGYNRELDREIFAGHFKDANIYAMRRISKNNDWCETSVEQIAECQYGIPYPAANAVLIVELEKK